MRDGERALPLLSLTVLSTHPRNAHESLNLDLWLNPECLVPILVGLRNAVELNQLLINAQQPARFHVSSPPCPALCSSCVRVRVRAHPHAKYECPCPGFSMPSRAFSRRDRGPDHRTVISCRAISHRFVWSPVMLASCLISPRPSSFDIQVCDI